MSPSLILYLYFQHKLYLQLHLEIVVHHAQVFFMFLSTYICIHNQHITFLHIYEIHTNGVIQFESFCNLFLLNIVFETYTY